MEFWLCLFLATPLILAVVGFGVWLINYHLGQRADRFTKMFWHQADQLGNYPIFYDPRSGHLVAVEPGNPAYPIQQHFINAPAQVAARPAPVERPLIINYGRPAPAQVAPAPDPEPALNPGIEPERLPEPVQVEPTIEEQLATAKREGRPKAATIEALTGAKKGGGESYRYWSAYWQSLPGPVEG